MGIEAILAGIQGVGNVASQGTNILQVIDQMMRNSQYRNNSGLYSLINSGLDQYNSMPAGGAYGDPSTVFGGVLGSHADGTPIQPGEAMAQTTAQFLNNNPANQAMNTLNAASSMRRPQGMSFADTFGGNPSGSDVYRQSIMPQMSQPVPTPAAAPIPAGSAYPNPRQNTDVAGAIPPQKPDASGGLLAQVVQRMQQNNQNAQAPNYSQNATPTINQSNLSTQNNPPFAGGKFPGMRSYDVGTNFVPETGPALIHKGEAIVPANQNPANPMNRYAQVRQAMMGMNSQNRQPAEQQHVATLGAPQTTQQPTQQQSAANNTLSYKMPTTQTPAQSTQQPTQATTQPVQPTSGSSGAPVTNPITSYGGSSYSPVAASPATTAQQPSIDSGRVAILQQLLANPQSFSPQVQQQIMQGLTDTSNQQLQGQMRGINEDAAARGLSMSGIPVAMGQQAYDTSNANLMNAQRQLGSQAALQNFQDMGNTANLALNQQTQMGQNQLAYQNMQNQMFDSDRNYNTNLANQQYQLGSNGQNSQLSMLSNLLNQSTGAQSTGLNQLSQLMNLLGQQYGNIGQTQQLQPFNVNYYQPQQAKTPGFGDQLMSAFANQAGKQGSNLLFGNPGA